MADLHDEFQSYLKKIELSGPQKQALRTSRNEIRRKIRKHFRDILGVAEPKFHMQGSFATKTTVVPLGGEYDVDDGIYLLHLDDHDASEWPEPETVHQWLIDATKNHTKEEPIDMPSCVRVRYAGSYHVDLPSYARLNDDFFLAVTGKKGWTASDPKAITDWFLAEVKTHGEQLRTIVKYVKAWADFQSQTRGKMPSSIVLTVLAAENYIANDRDDIALANTISAIENDVTPFVKVMNPVDLNEELTDRCDAETKARFKVAISSFASNSTMAIDSEKRSKASQLWRKELGDRFPEVPAEEDVEVGAAAAGGIFISKSHSGDTTPRRFG